jgi:hypothetical protein
LEESSSFFLSDFFSTSTTLLFMAMAYMVQVGQEGGETFHFLLALCGVLCYLKLVRFTMALASVGQFVILLTAIEIVSAVFYSDSGVAHLVHLGGMLAGYLMIKIQGPNLSGGGGGFFRRRGAPMSRDEIRSRLRVISNQDTSPRKGDKGIPITWNRRRSGGSGLKLV